MSVMDVRLPQVDGLHTTHQGRLAADQGHCPRCMPNTLLMLAAGMTPFCKASHRKTAEHACGGVSSLQRSSH
jgi:pyrroline-5-carboxylate reductase